MTAKLLDLKRGVLVLRGSLEVGDVLSDLSANPMELSLLGVQGQYLCRT